MKKALFLSLLVLMASAIVFAAGSGESAAATSENNINPAGVFPIAKETMQVRLFLSVPENVIDIDTNEAILYIEEYTNLDLVIDAGPSNSQEKVALLLAAQQNLPDAFLTSGAISREQLALYGEQGVFVPLNSYREEGWLPNLEAAFEYQPLIEPQVTMPDGNMYSFPRYSECQHCLHSQKMWINQAWLDNLGLETPTSIDEFYDVLVAFKENDANGNGDPDDEIPFLGLASGWRTDLTGFIMQPFAPATLAGDLFLYNDDGTIRSGIHHDGWQEGIAFLHQLYQEGLLDEESFVMDGNMAKALSGASSGNRIGSVQSGSMGGFANLSVPGARDDFAALEPLAAADRSRRSPFFRASASTRYVVTAAAEERELAAVRLGDLMMINAWSGDPNDLEVGLNMQYGPNGWVEPEDAVGLSGEPAIYEWIFDWGAPNNLNFANLNALFAPIEKKATLATAEVGSFSHEKVLWDATEQLYEPHSADIVLPPVIVPSDRASEIGEIRQILADYIEENFANFIIGERDIDSEWDEFLEELNDFGMEGYIETIQSAYDSMYR